ncbi:A24 family peptidase [Aureimonas mangrovi]|uniref:A24 family peptidase n=1 Tax=Aureimonas mangrovi TaxID=2758041 RepID=UPI00163D68A5|nr:prepilin peptidase [Aureimonas mangrovi]
MLIALAFILLMFWAMASDIASMTISNRLCLALAAVFPFAALAYGLSSTEIGVHALTGALALALTFALFSLNWMGGGDAKLIAATALWFGPTQDLSNYLLFASLIGGALTLFILVARAVRQPTTGLVFLDRLLTPSVGIPYGVALGSAAIAVFLTGRWGQSLGL